MLDEVWGPGYDTETHYLRVRGPVAQEARPDGAAVLVAEPGIGYRLVDRVRRRHGAVTRCHVGEGSAVLHLRLATGAQRREGRVHHQRALQ